MVTDRDYTIFETTGFKFLENLWSFLQSSPLSEFWSVKPDEKNQILLSASWGGYWDYWHRARITVQHKETGEYFNLVSLGWPTWSQKKTEETFLDTREQVLVIHNCGETVPLIEPEITTFDRIHAYWDLQYNIPSSSIVLTYPEGMTPTEVPTSLFTVIGTSQFILIASQFKKEGLECSSTGIFGFMKSYSETRYKITGGLPTDNFTCIPFKLEHHFWERGYQNFTVKFAEGMTLYLTTFQVHDLSDLVKDYESIELTPLIYYEKGGEEYSGRIAGELFDCWRVLNSANDLNIRDRLYLGDSDGMSILAMIFKDGEQLSKAVAVRFM